jgi:steroid delta-isomerase-like uncharacterized protein
MTDAERVWTTYINAWNRHDIDSILATVAEQFVYDERPMTMSDVIRGRPAFREYLRRMFGVFPDLRIQVTSCESGSSLAMSESIMRGTYAGRTVAPFGRGRQISARVACVFKVADGVLLDERLYWDRANTMRQLGLLPAIVSVATAPVVVFHD